MKNSASSKTGASNASLKRILLPLLALILIAAPVWNRLPGETVFAASGGEWIRVGLRYGSNAPASCTVAATQGFFLGSLSGGSVTVLQDLSDYRSLTVTASDNRVRLSAGDTVILENMGSETGLFAFDDQRGGTVRLEGAAYRGGLIFHGGSGGLTVINCLDVESYLYGVLHSEMGRNNPAEALKAQAVAARSFAVCSLGKHQDSGFDVCTSTHCQVYKGAGGEYPETTAAVQATAGQKLYHGGSVVGGYYYKNSGGHTQSAQDVWGSNHGYLLGVKDDFSPEYTWTWSLSATELKAILQQAGQDPGDIVQVAVSGRNDSGHVTGLEITGSRTTVALDGGKLRAVFDSTLLKSTNFSLSAGTGDSRNSNAGGIHAAGSSRQATLSGSVSVLSSSGQENRKTAELYLAGATSTVKAGSGKDRSSAEASRGGAGGEMVVGGDITFSGTGYGHGVGMPQDSAVAMAKAGYGYLDILKKYYTNIEVRQ